MKLQKPCLPYFTQKVQINGDIHGEVMYDIGGEQGCSLFPTILHMYLETYLGELDGDSQCLFNMVVEDVVMLSKSRANLQRLLNKLHDYFIFSNLEVDLSKTKIMIFGGIKRKSNQEAFYLNKDQKQSNP